MNYISKPGLTLFERLAYFTIDIFYIITLILMVDIGAYLGLRLDSYLFSVTFPNELGFILGMGTSIIVAISFVTHSLR